MGNDTAFMDRIHAYMPGWDVAKLKCQHVSSYGSSWIGKRQEKVIDF